MEADDRGGFLDDRGKADNIGQNIIISPSHLWLTESTKQSDHDIIFTISVGRYDYTTS